MKQIHLPSPAALLRPGEYALHGQQIGTVGSTVRAAGPQEHFEIIQNGGSVDPVRLSP